MIKIAILLLLISGSVWAADVSAAPKEKQSSLMDILDEAGRQCRAMGPGACRTFIARPASEEEKRKTAR